MPTVVVETQGRPPHLGLRCFHSPTLRPDLYDLSQHVSADSSLKATLEKNMHATQRLVTSFLKSRPAVDHDATYQRCQKAQTEVCVRLFGCVSCPLRGVVYGIAVGDRDDAEAVTRGGAGLGAMPRGTLGSRDANRQTEE